MTKHEALEKLKLAAEIIFSVEEKMDLMKSDVRRKGYWARISLGDFGQAIRRQETDIVEEMV